MVGSQSPSSEVEQVARALLQRGSIRESIALLRGALARDGEEEGCAALLEDIVGGDVSARPTETVELDFGLVDRWIRRGMLVEALALLGGTTMGSMETGREWANLLGELLAPVPVDAEEALVEMHHQLTTGGASVALTLLEERTKREPRLAAWALRRLELLRWMLLDNAAVAEGDAELRDEAPSLLAAAIRGPLNQRNVFAALDAARAFLAEHPDDADAVRCVEALESATAEVERHAADAIVHTRTIPMFGHPAAALQLRMGNLDQACAVYRKMIAKDESDDHARLMLAEVEAILRAVEGEPVVESQLGGEATQVFLEDEESTIDSPPHPALMDIPTTNLTRMPEARSAPEESGPMYVTEITHHEDDAATTTESLRADEEAERLVADSELVAAEAIYRSLASARPDEPRFVRRADELRERIAAAHAEADGVLVRAIKSVK